MATQTENYKLTKPAQTDAYDIDVHNTNSDIIDAELKTLSAGVLEAKKSASDGKGLIAAAITLQGVVTAATDTFAKMASNIKSIITGSGNAIASDVLEGRTFTNSTGIEQTGTIPRKSAQTYTPQISNQTIAAGQYLAEDQTILSLGGNATAGNVVSGVTFSSNSAGRTIAGTMPVRGTVSASIGINGTYTIPAGYHYGNGTVSQNIPTKSAATYTPGTAAQTIAAGQYLSGIQTIDSIGGNATPSMVLAGGTFGSNSAGRLATGTMINRGAISTSIGINGSYTIPQGYHDGSGKVGQSVATKGAATYIPGTSAQTIAAGQYLSGAQTIAAIPSNWFDINTVQTVFSYGSYGPLASPGAYYSSAMSVRPDSPVTISVMAIVFTAITFFTNRSSSSSKDGERWGSLNKELEYIGNDLKEIKELVKNNETQMNSAIDGVRKWTKDNINHLHTRLDDHLRDEHDMTVPVRNP